ncbi:MULTISPECIES: hypothetical protein, partial [unclassified Nocardia]
IPGAPGCSKAYGSQRLRAPKKKGKDIMSSNSHLEQADDPRAQWRRLPAEPAYYVEETDVDGSSSSYTVPAVDPGQDFVRLYGA